MTGANYLFTIDNILLANVAVSYLSLLIAAFAWYRQLYELSCVWYWIVFWHYIWIPESGTDRTMRLNSIGGCLLITALFSSFANGFLSSSGWQLDRLLQRSRSKIYKCNLGFDYNSQSCNRYHRSFGQVRWARVVLFWVSYEIGDAIHDPSNVSFFNFYF